MPTFSEIFAPAAAVQAPAPAGTTNPSAANPNTTEQFPKSTTPDPVAQQTAPLEPFKDLFTIDPNKVQEDPNAPFITYDKTCKLV
jgi:hypothetical protein